MKAPYIEGIANHDDPESCAAVRKDCREALTGARAGWVLSRSKWIISGGADAVIPCGRQHLLGRYGKAEQDPRAVADPHARNLSAREPGDPRVARRLWNGGTHREGQGRKPMTHDPRKSDRSVVPVKPSNKRAAPWRRRWRKGLGPGEHGPAKRAPDTVPGRRAKCAGPCTSACTKGQESQVQQSVSPSHGRTTTASVLGAKTTSERWRRRRDLGAVPSSTGCPHPGLARSPSPRRLTS